MGDSNEEQDEVEQHMKDIRGAKRGGGAQGGEERDNVERHKEESNQSQ